MLDIHFRTKKKRTFRGGNSESGQVLEKPEGEPVLPPYRGGGKAGELIAPVGKKQKRGGALCKKLCSTILGSNAAEEKWISVNWRRLDRRREHTREQR